MQSVQKKQGFTLVELLVVVAIIGIVAVLGYPSYQNFVKDGYRSTVEADLMAFAAAMERHKAATFSYSGAAVGSGDTGAPAVFQAWSPSSESSTNKRYDLTISSLSGGGVGYVLKATPVSGTTQQGDGALYYYSDGRKGWDKNSNGSLSTDEFCWQC